MRHATEADLPAIVAIYNASIPGRLATADTVAVTVDDRRDWFASFNQANRPLWVAESDGRMTGWLGLRSFYGRPAYHRCVEAAVYVAPEFQRRGTARALLQHAIDAAPALGIATLLAFVFGHNEASLALFRLAGFSDWGTLPRIAELDGIERDLVILGRRLTP
ncbi:MAG: N-acetyltransferase [Betaproteobacteria bacterium]|nr:N-acetyltransferase [Betaproteobacteria bacterium]